MKLPVPGFHLIRFTGVFHLSRSVPRPRNKRSDAFRCGAPGHDEGHKTQHMGHLFAGKAIVTTIYGGRRPLRGGVVLKDPELPFFGSSLQEHEKLCIHHFITTSCHYFVADYLTTMT
ncbi:hypothetical protein [Cedecea sp. NFIX57]|uniref:hypothetical protein n=1 Tax=Cedecea sp. NFIX57 TaxID=1566286 RepID=UPI00111C6D62|nr:hypothetical protein [Cedecea sp. NFIX57]